VLGGLPQNPGGEHGESVVVGGCSGYRGERSDIEAD
jgi:hypothetical protein